MLEAWNVCSNAKPFPRLHSGWDEVAFEPTSPSLRLLGIPVSISTISSYVYMHPLNDEKVVTVWAGYLIKIPADLPMPIVDNKLLN